MTSRLIKSRRTGRITSQWTSLLAIGDREVSGAINGTLSLKEVRLRSDFSLRISIAQLGDLAFE
jgi:hypothetical protein